MNITLALVFVCAAVGAVTGSTELQVTVKNELTTPVEQLSAVQNDLKSPAQYILNVGTPLARNSLLDREQIIRSAQAGIVQIHEYTWIGLSHRVISSVQAYQVGVNQGARAGILAGGVGFNFVTVLIESERGRGFNVVIEIYGR